MPARVNAHTFIRACMSKMPPAEAVGRIRGMAWRSRNLPEFQLFLYCEGIAILKTMGRPRALSGFVKEACKALPARSSVFQECARG
eukprot:6576786-Pyramimonas_sp.AAC.2